MPTLSPKRERFCHEYIIDLNGTQAAIRAGFSKRTAGKIAEQLLRNPAVSELVQELSKKTLDKLEITSERVLQELARIAFFDMRKLFDADGTLKGPLHLDDHTAHAIAGFAMSGNGSGTGLTKIKTVSKAAALEILAKHLSIAGHKLVVETNQPEKRVHVYMPHNGRDRPDALHLELEPDPDIWVRRSHLKPHETNGKPLPA